MVDMSKVTEYATKKLKARALEAEVTALKRECAELMPELLEAFTQEGVQNVKVSGIGTVYLSGQIWAGAIKDENGESDMQRSCDALKRAGLGVMVREQFNSNTLSAYVRELPRNEIGTPILPEELQGEISVAEVFDLRVKSS